jgi:hypothetical protein
VCRIRDQDAGRSRAWRMMPPGASLGPSLAQRLGRGAQAWASPKGFPGARLVRAPGPWGLVA